MGYRMSVGGVYTVFKTIWDWFPVYCANELNLDIDSYHVSVKWSEKKLAVGICENATNNLLKTIYMNEDITKNFVKGSDGLYYNAAWSGNGSVIVEDGLGWTIENVRDFVLEFLVMDEVKEHNEYENVLDDIRYCVN